MTDKEKQKAIDALNISVPVMAVTQEEFNDYIQTLNQVMDWLVQEPQWIPIGKRPLTDEERKEYGEEIEFMYDCELPDDGQEVQISTPYGVKQTTFYTDYGCYFEGYEDEGEVTAWMPLPQPYKAENEDK